MVLEQLQRKRALLEQQITEDHKLGHPTDQLLDYHQELTQAIHQAETSKPAKAKASSN